MAERTCSVEGCEGKHKARGYCIRHYTNLKRHGDPHGIRFKRPPSPGLKWCPRCQGFVPVVTFGVSRARKDGLTAYCRPCIRVLVDERDPDRSQRRQHNHRWSHTEHGLAYYREWKRQQKQRDPEGVRYRRKRWEQERRDVLRAGWARNGPIRRARLAGAPTLDFSDVECRARLAYFGHRCWICGDPADSLDHVKPLSKGGWHALANLRPACFSCNSRKGARWPLPTTPVRLCREIRGWSTDEHRRSGPAA